MTPSPLPWSVKSNVDGSASLRDATNEIVAVFRSWRDAETALEKIIATTTLEKQIEDLVEKVEELEYDKERLEMELHEATSA